MANCYKNFPVTVTYSDSTTSDIYSNSVSISESLALEHAESLGIKGSNAVFNFYLPEGSIDVESYVTDSLSKFNDLQGSNDNNIQVQAGPYTMPTPCTLSSMSVNITVGEPITCSRSFSYVGSAATGTSPAPIVTPLSAAVPENITLNGYDSIGGSNIIKSATWTFSQEYEKIHLLGNVNPVVVFKGGQISLDIDGEQLTTQLMSTGSSCPISPKNYSISISGCNGSDLGTLSVTSGYMQSRSSSVAQEGIEENGVSIIQYL